MQIRVLGDDALQYPTTSNNDVDGIDTLVTHNQVRSDIRGRIIQDMATSRNSSTRNLMRQKLHSRTKYNISFISDYEVDQVVEEDNMRRTCCDMYILIF